MRCPTTYPWKLCDAADVHGNGVAVDAGNRGGRRSCPADIVPVPFLSYALGVFVTSV
jgi:hypothetical protein